jgi:sialate O-acetylesterase
LNSRPFFPKEPQFQCCDFPLKIIKIPEWGFKVEIIGKGAMNFRSVKSVLFVMMIYFSLNTLANVSLPAIFSDHIVLQQNQEVILWGWAKPNEEVKVTASWNNYEVKVIADNQANWSLKFKTPMAGGPYQIKIKGYNEIVLNDVLIGEVWLCSGQSNMEWTPRAGIEGGEDAIKNANFPEIRLFTVDVRSAINPQGDLGGKWLVCSPETMIDFSAIGYFFGKKINQELNVPVGIINASWGGTPAEVLIPAEIINQDPILATTAQKLGERKWCPVKPGRAYNAMIAPLIPFRIAGVLWYQGETNTDNPLPYKELFSTLIQTWRSLWGYEFPFYYFQIAPYKYGTPKVGAIVRDAQRRVLTVPKTGMVVISDIGNTEDIHPRNKKDAGIRLANLVLNKTYGKSGIAIYGPLYKEYKIEKNKIRIYFDYADGLNAKGGKLTNFEIAGEDRKFYSADAEIQGGTVVISSPKVKAPVAVRFAWDNTATPNLFNSAGLPASCFRTDDWEITIE